MAGQEMQKPHPPELAKIKALLIFNPISGVPADSPDQLLTILNHLQIWNILPEVYLVQPESNLAEVARDAYRRGIRLVIASGGDGTVDAVMGGLVGTRSTLGIIPSGTQNNTARALGIPVDDLGAAVKLLRLGNRVRVDVGLARCGQERRWFLETATVGLISALFPAADAIQHGDLIRLGDFLSTLVSSSSADIHIELEKGRKKLDTVAHVALVINMPYLGPQFQLNPKISYSDGLFDVAVFSNLSKLDLLGVAVQVAGGASQDSRIEYFLAREIFIHTDPPMPVMVDGFMMGEGDLEISIRPHALAVMSNTMVAQGVSLTSPISDQGTGS